MNLTARNKIAEYIDKEPEARITLLTWLKEYPYREGKSCFSGQEGKPASCCGAGQSQPGVGDYIIKYKINSLANTVLITWVGSKQEYIAQTEREFKEMQEKNPNLKRESIKVKEVVISPQPKKIKKQLKDRVTETDLNMAILSPDAIRKINSSDTNQDFGQHEGFKTETEYQNALSKVIASFESQPDTAEFNELSTLLPLVKHYEGYKLEFPPIEAFEIVKYKMEMLGLPPDSLATLIGSEDKVKLFLSGKQELSAKMLARVYQKLHIKIPVCN